MRTFRLLLKLAIFLTLLVPAAARAECGGTTQCIGVGPTVAAAQLANHGLGPDTFIIEFSVQPVGSTSASRTIFVEAVTGPTGTMAQLAPTTITGADAGSFTVTGGTCSPSNGPVHGGAGCTITVAFSPTSIGGKSAILHVNLASPGCVGCITERIVTLQGDGTPPASSGPVASPVTVDVPSGASRAINLASSISGNFTRVFLGSQPAHGTAVLSGTTVTYTPTAGYIGPDNFTYGASGPDGNSNLATVTINVIAPSAPVAAARSASTAFGTPVAIDLAPSITGAYTSIAIARAPANGTATLNGTVVTYTPASGFAGTDSFTYTASGPGGTSAAATVTITITTTPPTAAPTAVTVQINTPTVIDLAPLVSGSGVTTVSIVTRPTRGTVAVSGLRVTYTPSLDYFGPDAFTYAAVGVAGTSAPATVSITVVGRPDPTRNPGVTGLLAAQAASAERFSQAQVANVQGRMESLHRREAAARSASFLHSTVASTAALPTMADAVSLLSSGSVSLARSWANFWVSGTARFGQRGATGTTSALDFTTSGITVGADGRMSDRLAVGAGIGFGRDRTDIGADGSTNRARGASLAAYASYQPTPRTFVDTIVGIGSLDFKSRRFVAPVSDFASAERDGDYVFASVAAGYEHRANGVLFSPYARIDHSSATFDAATETGAGVYALAYARQRSPATQGVLGFRAETVHEAESGWANAKARVEYRRAFSGARSATITYADIPGTHYLYSPERRERNAFVLGLGTEFILRNGLTAGIEYQLLRASSRDSDQGIRLYLSQDLDGRGNAGWLSTFRLEPTAPRDVQVDAGFTYDDNVARSQRAVDEVGDWSFGANVRVTELFDLSRNVRAVASGLLGAERFRDFNGLGRATAGLEGEIQYRPSGEFGAPTFAAFAQGYADAYESRLRDGARFNLGVSARKALTDRITGFGALAYSRRHAESDVFDATEYSGRVNLDYQWSSKDTFYATGEYRRGHAVGIGRPPSPSNPFPHSHDFTSIALAVDDDVFPGYVAYRFKAASTIATLGYNRALGPRHSIDLSWRRVETKARPGWGIETLYGTVIMSRYVTNQYLLLYLLSF